MTAMTMLPLTVARTTAAKRAMSWALYSSLSGIAERMFRAISAAVAEEEEEHVEHDPGARRRARSVSWPMLSALPAITWLASRSTSTSRPRISSRLPTPSRSSQCCTQGGSAACRLLRTLEGSMAPLCTWLTSSVPSRTSAPTMSVIGMIAITMQTSTLRKAARLLRGPKRYSKLRCSGWKTMARITAQKTAP